MRLFLRLSGRRGSSSSSYSHHHHHHHHQQQPKKTDDDDPGDDFEARCCFARNSYYSDDEVLVLVVLVVVVLFRRTTLPRRRTQAARFVCLQFDLSPGGSFRDIFFSRGIELLSLSLSLFGNERLSAQPFSAAKERGRAKREKTRDGALRAALLSCAERSGL